jgi:hypothetical protein
LVVITAAAMTAAGCGRTERVRADRTLDVAVTEYRLDPDRASAPAGTLTFVVHNYGRLAHNLVVSQDGHPTGATQAIAPGQTAVLLLWLPRGTYSLSSSILSDASLGARGTLNVG